MKNRIQPGRTMTVLAAASVKSGDLVVAGVAFGVANSDAATGAPVEVSFGEVFALPKATGQAWTFGQAAYWDATAKVVTTTAATNLKIGIVGDAVSAAATGPVRLNDSF